MADIMCGHSIHLFMIYITRKYHIDAQKWTTTFNIMIMMIAHEGLYSNNILRPRQQSLPNHIFKFIIFYKYCCFFIKISLKFAPRGQINNQPSLVLIMAWHTTSTKTVSTVLIKIFIVSDHCHIEILQLYGAILENEITIEKNNQLFRG